MEKLPMCRICLAEDVRMYVVVTKDLHELYERLTLMPFVTKDSRPILACSFCCAELKRSFRLLRRCLEAEELFAQIMKGNYEPKPLANQHELIISPIENINIVEVGLTESVVVKEELPAVCERQDDIVKPREEYQNDDLELENLDNHPLDVGDVLPPHDSEPDSEDDVPLMQFTGRIVEEEEQKASKAECRAVETNTHCATVAGSHHVAPNARSITASQKEATASHSLSLRTMSCTRAGREKSPQPIAGPTVAKKRKRQLRRSKSEDSKPADQKINQVTDSTAIQSTRKRTSKAQYKKRHECEICHRNFSQKGNLKLHLRTHTGEKPYKCDVCQRCYRHKKNLIDHSRSHTGEKPYKCDVCQNCYINKTNLINHIRTHTGEKPYKCDVCHRCFRLQPDLAYHIRTHTGEKPFKCDICRISFYRKTVLNTHIRTHTGEKPYKCDVCQRCFRHKPDLTFHIRTHTGEKPYECDICQVRFIRKTCLKKHIRKHTGEKPYKCDVCQRRYKLKRDLSYHIIRTHW